MVSRPLSPYLRYELGWRHTTTMTAGVEFFILDMTERPSPLGDIGDFWLFDSATAGPMSYTDDGGSPGPTRFP
ncbi:hypothetical protein GA0115261_1010712 [Streptomyces sp. OspMP-M43]|nr:hypothetical protein GA0115261_1010712 [Streptomyces sp. OspMP-M43]